MFQVKLIDVVADFRRAFGNDALREMCEAMGISVGDHDYRFEVTTDDGTQVTFHGSATASNVARYLVDRGERL